jgi:hypothetical protein
MTRSTMVDISNVYSRYQEVSTVYSVHNIILGLFVIKCCVKEKSFLIMQA